MKCLETRRIFLFLEPQSSQNKLNFEDEFIFERNFAQNELTGVVTFKLTEKS